MPPKLSTAVPADKLKYGLLPVYPHELTPYWQPDHHSALMTFSDTLEPQLVADFLDGDCSGYAVNVSAGQNSRGDVMFALINAWGCLDGRGFKAGIGVDAVFAAEMCKRGAFLVSDYYGHTIENGAPERPWVPSSLLVRGISGAEGFLMGNRSDDAWEPLSMAAVLALGKESVGFAWNGDAAEASRLLDAMEAASARPFPFSFRGGSGFRLVGRASSFYRAYHHRKRPRSQEGDGSPDSGLLGAARDVLGDGALEELSRFADSLAVFSRLMEARHLEFADERQFGRRFTWADEIAPMRDYLGAASAIDALWAGVPLDDVLAGLGAD